MTQVSMIKVNKKAKKVYRQEVLHRGLFGVLLVVALAVGVVAGGFFFPAVRTASSLEPDTPGDRSAISAAERSADQQSDETEATFLSVDASPPPAAEAPVPAPVEEQPATTITETTDPADISMIILNGSGIDGEAGRFAEYAEGKGVSVVGTANARQWDHEETEIYFSEDNAEKAKLVMELLGKQYPWIMYTEALDGRDADIVIVLGTTSPLQGS
ncbi:hypothetical protein AUK40_05425 [Candidatus Wirthbacteria bacterium CG2_30_54_11]|uniref:LytR/CpsA/Psr regulator C-terminal domain-containing protein n=1 Tax=Candidatus Wirthbacteria bacterium CG2_30_54_11 TaxID=1817892 RepID=A0A1J5IXL4_9BACT|nr:MAG: hypothetical protein AUK40_05425 [Candidatus Wirthbacteria bacterium CG2_30_54_11]